MDKYRVLLQNFLLEIGFSKAEKMITTSTNYYSKDTEFTAFFVNVKDRGDCVGVCFGSASTAFTRMSGCENSLTEHGILNEDACLKEFVFIKQSNDLDVFYIRLERFMHQYSGMEKDLLLQTIKDRRKVFIEKIHGHLKPYGFKKKGNEWRLVLPDNNVLSFHADKNPYCDSYEFDVELFAWNNQEQKYQRCIYHLFQPSLKCHYGHVPYRFDWQLNTSEELMDTLTDFKRKYADIVLYDGMRELVKQEYIKEKCRCDRRCCENCWFTSDLSE